MPIEPTSAKVGTLVRIEEGSYFCEKAMRYIPISFCKIGVIVNIYIYDPHSYPWEILGYKFLADVMIGQHRLRDIPDFKMFEAKNEK